MTGAAGASDVRLAPVCACGFVMAEAHESKDGVKVVALVRVVSHAIAPAGAAACALVDDHVALGGVVLDGDRAHQRVAVVGTVSGRDVHVQRVQAVRAVVAVASVDQCRDRLAAVFAGEAGVFGCSADGAAPQRVEGVFNSEAQGSVRSPPARAGVAGLTGE